MLKRYFPEGFILLSFLTLIVTLFVFKTALMPFFIGSAISYISYPIFKLFLRISKGRKRISAILTTVLFLILVIILVFIILPIIINQIQDFIIHLPLILKKIDAVIFGFLGKHYLTSVHLDTKSIELFIKSMYDKLSTIPIGDITSRITYVVNHLFSGISSAIGVIVNMVTVPIIIYYFLMDAGKIKKIYVNLAPREFQSDVSNLLDDMHDALSSYLLGQMLIALIVGIYIAIGLYIVGIRYSLLIGLIAGILNMIPYLGFYSSIVPSLLLATFDNGDWAHVIGVLVVFFSELIIENLLYPMVMRRTTGINPLITLLAIFLGGVYGGVLGIIIAVPSVIAVMPLFESFMKKKSSVC